MLRHLDDDGKAAVALEDPTGLTANAVRQILRRRAAQAGLAVSGLKRLSPHGLRASFITEVYRQGARDEMEWTAPDGAAQ